MNPKEDLPLQYFTPPEWVETALSDTVELLNDHAHLEKKAATNALELLLRWPKPTPKENWVNAMTSVANDEVAHLQIVTKYLAERGGSLSRVHANAYANELRQLVRFGKGDLEVLDRLLVSALIEARSCERFCLLANSCPDAQLARLYGNLYQSEAGHYRVFLALARDLGDVDKRWKTMLREEARIVKSQEPRPRMHSGRPAA